MTDTTESTRQDADDQDQELLAQARAHIAEEFGGQPPDVQLTIEDKRIHLSGKVRDADTAQRIAKAAAIGPGVLGVHDELELEVTRDAVPSVSEEVSKEAEYGMPLPPPDGVIHNKI